MTTTEVRDQLAARFPRLTFAVSETAWIHGLGLSGEKYVEYVIGVQPGFNGTECQNFSDNSFEACLAKLNEAAGA